MATRRENPIPVNPTMASFKHRESQLIESPIVWMKDKRAADLKHGDIPRSMWRVDGVLYDLSEFVAKHPGGAEWLEVTRGTDVTDLFNVHHFASLDKTRRLLEKYRVRASDTAPDSAFDWSQSDGFYRTLQRRVAARFPTRASRAPTLYMLALSWFAVVAYTLVFALAAWRDSLPLAVVAGVLLHGCLGVGHNFFHQRNHVLRYAFDLSFFSSHHWRISHAISHHTYPNSMIDTEVSSFEPFLYFISNQRRNPRLLVHALYHVICATGSTLDVLRHVFCVLVTRTETARAENALPFVYAAVAAALCPAGAARGLLVFWVTQATASWLLTTISFAVHRTDHASTAGDEAHGERRIDFGRFIMAATNDHSFSAPLFLSCFAFAFLNCHTPHHLFPTIDHSHLHEVLPIVNQTAREFMLPPTEFHSFWTLYFASWKRHDMLSLF